jgi:hypothetical protein
MGRLTPELVELFSCQLGALQGFAFVTCKSMSEPLHRLAYCFKVNKLTKATTPKAARHAETPGHATKATKLFKTIPLKAIRPVSTHRAEQATEWRIISKHLSANPNHFQTRLQESLHD